MFWPSLEKLHSQMTAVNGVNGVNDEIVLVMSTPHDGQLSWIAILNEVKSDVVMVDQLLANFSWT